MTKSPDKLTYLYGEEVTLSATADPGWTFTGWTPSLTGNKVTINGNTTVTANYSQNEYTLTIVSDHGTVTKNPDKLTYLYGEEVTLSAAADPGWTFTGWTPSLTGNKVTINGNTTVTANYSQDEYTLTVVSDHGTVTKSPDKLTYHYGEDVTLSATADPGWTFTGWTPSLTGNKVTINGNTTVTANYSQNEYTLTVVSDHGTVTKSPDKLTYRYGDVVTLTATPATGWTFGGWSGDLSGSTNPDTITISANKTVTATFSTTCVPVAGTGFLFAPTSPRVGQPVTFTASVTAGTAPITYMWNFGDGGSLVTTTTVIQHPFPLTTTLRTYTTMLTATNACSNQSIQKPIVVRPYGIYLPMVTRNP